jgi:hypothetical protein
MQILSKLYDWLAVSDVLQRSDLIFVLAGRECRKHFGLRMFAEGWASTLLLSVGRFEIRKFGELTLPAPTDLVALASAIPPQRRHFFVAVREGQVQTEMIPWRQFGTWREIRALAEWLRGHEMVQTLTIISSGFHLRRVRWCCERLLPKGVTAKFLAVPAEFPSCDRSQWWRNASSRKLVLLEVVKVVLYSLLRTPRVSALKGNGAGSRAFCE